MKYGGSRFVEEGDHETWFSNTVQPLEHLYAVESSSLLQTHLNNQRTLHVTGNYNKRLHLGEFMSP